MLVAADSLLRGGRARREGDAVLAHDEVTHWRISGFIFRYLFVFLLSGDTPEAHSPNIKLSLSPFAFSPKSFRIE